MASADLRKELECSVCLNLYTDPVTLKCGHNFCRDCIGRVLDAQEGSGGYSCPDCREEFEMRPALRRNVTLNNVMKNYISAQPGQDNGIFCTYCIHTPVPAVKSCLLCEASLCDNHLRVHSKSPEHVLCDPTTSLEDRKCSIHKKILEYYCTEDSACICVSCSLAGEHRGHQVETLDEASDMRKEKLRNVLQRLVTETEETERRAQSLQERRRKVQGKAAEETQRVTALFRDLRRRLEELEKRVLSEISGQAERISLSLSDIIQQLEIKKDELSRKMRHIEELCNMTDPLTVLQESDTGNFCDTEDGDDEDRERQDKLLHDGGDLDVVRISHTLHKGLSDIMSGVNVQEPDTGDWHDIEDDEESDTGDLYDTEDGDEDRGRHNKLLHDLGDLDMLSDKISGVNVQERTGTYVDPYSTTKYKGYINANLSRRRPQPTDTVQHSHRQAEGSNIGAVQKTSGVSGVTDIFLNVNTAGNNLRISSDRKSVSTSDYRQNRPKTPERFQCDQVLSYQSFSSGRHYWEVDVGGAEYWTVGMCYPSIDRRGKYSSIGDNKKSWGLERMEWFNQYLVRHDRKAIPIRGKVFSNRVRIDLDYEAGRISFYDLCKRIRHLYTFTTTFTEPLHAVLCVGEGRIKISEGN